MRDFLLGLIVGGGAVKIADYAIRLLQERREQRRDKIAHEKDRPRFRVDTSIIPGTHPTVPSLVVKILSLGRLPVTIDQGEAFIESSNEPERIEPCDFSGREISSVGPVVIEFPLPQKLMNPFGIGKPVVKVVCKFSHSGNKQAEHYESTYDRDARRFGKTEKLYQ